MAIFRRKSANLPTAAFRTGRSVTSGSQTERFTSDLSVKKIFVLANRHPKSSP